MGKKHNVNFQQFLRVARAANGLTQEQAIAGLKEEGINMTQKAYSRYETGRINPRKIRVETLETLAKIARVPPELLFSLIIYGPEKPVKEWDDIEAGEGTYFDGHIVKGMKLGEEMREESRVKSVKGEASPQISEEEFEW